MAGFSPGQKKMMGMASAVVLAGVLALAVLHGKTDWTPLYTQLAPADASAITKKLDSSGVAYQLADGGSTIEVSKDVVYQTRIDMASVSLPSDSTVGYGILDNQSMTSSDFMQQVSYQRAMEGELAKTIDAIDGVEASTVHLALPKDDTFALSDQAPSASVMVKTASGKSLTAEQTQAVVNLVASSIQNLTANEVTVADSQGDVLASPSTGVTGGGSGTDSSDDATSAYDRQVASAIESMLAPSVGVGKVKATVSAVLDFDQSAQTSETYSAPSTIIPNTPLVQSQSTKTETYGGSGPDPSGILGANNGTGSTNTTTGTTASGSGYNLDQNDSTPALNKVTEQINKAPGTVTHMSVAVMVDEKALPQSEVAKVQTMVSAAAGIQPSRGDTVVVNRMPFDTKLQKQMEAEVAAAAPASSSFPISLIIQGVIALAVLAGLVVTLKRRKAETEPISAAELTAGGLVHQPIPPSAVLPPRDNGQIITLPDQPMVNDRREVLGELIDNQPDEVAQVLRSWLGDRREVRR
jgi:flagellar M-ring protein FliF